MQWNLQCVDASASVTYSKEISFVFFLHSSQARSFLKAAFANTRVRNQRKKLHGNMMYWVQIYIDLKICS